MDILTYVLDADNLVKATGVTVSASSSADGYPASRLRALPVTESWRSSGTGSATIDIDLGSAQEVSLAALVNHNVRPAATVTVIGATNAAFNAGTVTWALSTVAPRNLWTLQDTAASRRYWRFQIDDSGNPDGFYRAGYIVLGKALKFPQQFAPGWNRNPRKIIRKSDSELGTPIVGKTISRGWQLSFEFMLSDEDTDTVEDILDSLDGDPMFMIPIPSRRHGFFVRLENATEPWTTQVQVSNGPNQISVSFLSDNDLP